MDDWIALVYTVINSDVLYKVWEISRLVELLKNGYAPRRRKKSKLLVIPI
jgi:hypothetical protein